MLELHTTSMFFCFLQFFSFATKTKALQLKKNLGIFHFFCPCVLPFYKLCMVVGLSLWICSVRCMRSAFARAPVLLTLGSLMPVREVCGLSSTRKAARLAGTGGQWSSSPSSAFTLIAFAVNIIGIIVIFSRSSIMKTTRSQFSKTVWQITNIQHN